MRALSRFAVAVALVSLSSHAADAVVSELDPISRGAYRGDTGAFGTAGSGTPTGEYLAGSLGGNELRNFFVYDLGAVGGLIVGAELQVDVGDFSSPDPSETYALFNVITSLTALTGNTGGYGAFLDLGNGASYGEIELTAADAGTVVSIPLGCAALAALNSAAGGDFALGGTVTSLGGSPNEFVFGNTLGAGFGAKLVLTTAPTTVQAIDPFSRGNYSSLTGRSGGTPTANYVAGFIASFPPEEIRSYFIYDLGAVSGLVVDAELRLSVGGFVSDDPSETYRLFDVTDVAALNGNTGGLAIFDDLGSGVSYAEIELTAADVGSVVTFPLDGSALAALNAAVGGDFAIGGALTDFVSLSGAQLLFDGTSGPEFVSTLVLTVIPFELTEFIDAFSRGTYRADTGAFGTEGSGTATGNYLVGRDADTLWFRNFFAFDLSAVEGCVVRAQLALDVGSFSSTAQVETYELFDVQTSIAALTGNTGGGFAFNDLGSGISYGEIDIGTDDDHAAVVHPLNGFGVSAINAALGGDFALGGTITSYGPVPELVFGDTLGAGNVSQLSLVVTPVPEPPATLLRLAALAALALLARAQAFLRRKRTTLRVTTAR